MKKSRGVSLMELIIYIGVMSIVIVAVTDLAGRLVFAQKKSNASSEISDTMNILSARMNNDIADATAVTGSFPSNTLSLTVNGHQLQYVLSSDVLTLSTDGGAPVPLNTSRIKIRSVEPSATIFTKTTNGSAVTIGYKMNYSLASGTGSVNMMQTSILMRAK